MFKLHVNFQKNHPICLPDSVPGANKMKLSKTALEPANLKQWEYKQ